MVGLCAPTCSTSSLLRTEVAIGMYTKLRASMKTSYQDDLFNPHDNLLLERTKIPFLRITGEKKNLS